MCRKLIIALFLGFFNIPFSSFLENFKKGGNFRVFTIIDKALQEKGISLQEFADGIGVSLSAVYEWKRGNYNPKADKLIAISSITNIPLDELLRKQG